MAMLLAQLTSPVPALAELDPTHEAAVRVRKDAQRLRAEGDEGAALEALKAGYAKSPGDEALVMALADAYQRRGNTAWAVRVLSRYLDEHALACNPRLFLVWIHARQGLTRPARQLLMEPGCSSPPELAARWHLLAAYLDFLEEHREATIEHTEMARKSSVLFEQDTALLAYLTAVTQPERTPTFTGLVNLMTGWTSQGLAGSPTDSVTRQNSATALSIADARLRWTLLNAGTIRPLLEGQLRAQQLWATQTSDLSFRTLTGRVGVQLRRELPRLTGLAVFDGTQIQGGDRYATGPIWFSEARRGEFELELPHSTFLMVGGGHRLFRESGRSRAELDATLGWAIPVGTKARFLGALSGRYHAANSQAYDLAGFTVISQFRHVLPKDFELGVTLSAAVDSYYNSQNYFSMRSTRRDVQWRGVGAVYSPELGQLRLVGKYEMSARRSSAEAYEFTDHRLLVAIEWQIDSDRLARTTTSDEQDVSRDYRELGAGGGSSSLQLRELMRQEETQRRGSSCLR